MDAFKERNTPLRGISYINSLQWSKWEKIAILYQINAIFCQERRKTVLRYKYRLLNCCKKTRSGFWYEAGAVSFRGKGNDTTFGIE